MIMWYYLNLLRFNKIVIIIYIKYNLKYSSVINHFIIHINTNLLFFFKLFIKCLFFFWALDNKLFFFILIFT